MKKLALNSLLAITTMAWLGQAPLADPKRESAGAGAPEIISPQPLAGFSAGDRAVLRNHVRELATLPRASHTRLQPGQVLTFDALRVARTLPLAVQERLTQSEDRLVLLLGEQLVQVRRSDRLVLDTLSLV